MQYLGLGDYLRSLWGRRWLIALAIVLSGGAAYGVSSQRAAQYVAKATLFVGPRAGLGETVPRAPGAARSALEELTFSPDFVAAYAELLFSRDYLASYAQLLRSRLVAERVVREEALPIAPEDLLERVGTNLLPETRIIQVSVKDTSPVRAQRIANALMDIFVDDVQKQYGGVGAEATVVDRALVPKAPVSPRPRRDGAIGGVLGLMVGVGAALLLAQTDTRLRSREDVEEALAPLPLLAVIPSGSRDGTPGVFLEEEREAPAAEAFRILRTSVQVLGVDRPVRTVLVTSPASADGRTTVAANLAATMAVAGHKTLLVETDLRRPMTHAHFGTPQSPGLTDVLLGERDLAEAIHPARIANLSILPSGALPPNPSELLGSRRMAELIDRARQTADVVVLDSPPALPVTDALVLAPHVDGVILVVRSERTYREPARQAQTSFERLGVRVLGVVLNQSARGGSEDYYRNDKGGLFRRRPRVGRFRA